MTRLVTTLSALSIEPAHLEKLNQFNTLFLQWNQRINLSAARSTDDIESHIRDSLHVVPHLRSSSRVIDVGSGGGFPVVVAAICLPALSFTAPSMRRLRALMSELREDIRSWAGALSGRTEIDRPM